MCTCSSGVRRAVRRGVLLISLGLTSLAAQRTDPPLAIAPDAFEDVPAPVEQPLPFSHKTHVGLGMQCRDCHVIPEPGFAASYPAESTCMACHRAVKADSPHIQRLKKFQTEGKPIPWERVYWVPDFVWFSHASHVEDAAIACETCHGPVAERDVLFQEKPTTMAACMECHARSNASNECDLCHDPG